MSLPVYVLRPEPGLSDSCDRLRAAGLSPVACPLFAIGPVAWSLPDDADIDALLLTSANALRHGGTMLDALRHLPAWCVGPHTGALAADMGFHVAHQGRADAATLLASAARPGQTQRLLWLAGDNRSTLEPPAGINLVVRTVYAVHPLEQPGLLPAHPAVIMLHSSAAARRLSASSLERAQLHIVAISADVATAAGPGWRSVDIAAQPDDRLMVALAARRARQ